MRVLNSTLILIFIAQSVAANEVSLASASNVTVGSEIVPTQSVTDNLFLGATGAKAITSQENLNRLIKNNMVNHSSVEYEVLNWFGIDDSSFNSIQFTSKVGLVSNKMNPVLPTAENNILSLVNKVQRQNELENFLNYEPSVAGFQKSKLYSIGVDNYNPCASIGGDFTKESIILDLYDFGDQLSNLSSSCREQLTEYSMSSIGETLNSSAYCDCVDTLPSQKERKFSKDTILNEFKDSFYKHLIAKRVSDFMKRLQNNAVKFQNVKESAKLFGTEVGSFTCNQENVSSIAKEIKDCFKGDAGDIIDKENNFEVTGVLNFLSDTNSSESRLNIVFDRANDVISKDRATSISSTSHSRFKDKIEERERQKRLREGAKKFTDLFIVEYSQIKKEHVRMPDKYLDKVNDFFKSSPLFRKDYIDLQQRYVDLYNLKEKSEGKHAGRNFSYTMKTIADISPAHEKKFAELFATIVNTRAIQSLVDSPNFKDPEKLDAALAGLMVGDPASVDSVHRSMGVNLADIYREEMESCEKEIEELKFACNPDNAQEVMKRLSAQEFVAVNDRVLEESNEDAISNSQMYCAVLDHEFIDQAIANSKSTGGSNLTADKVFASVDSNSGEHVFNGTTGDSDKERPDDGPNIISAAGTNVDALNTNNISNPNVAPSSSNDDDYNFSEAANLFDNINSNNSIPDSNVMDGNTLQSIVSNPTTSVDAIKEVKERVEDEVGAIEEELEKSEGSVSAAQMDENNALREQLEALKAQISELNAAITKRDIKEAEEMDKLETEKKQNVARIQEPKSNAFSSFGSSANNNSRRDNTFAPQQVSRASTTTNSAPSGSTATAGSFSSAGQGLSAINKLGATGGLGLSSTVGSSRGASGTVSNSKIGQSDQRLVAEAISNGNTSVVLADGRVYYIGQDEEGNVILSETAEEVMAGVMGPEEEGPQLPTPKVEEGARREIASEKEVPAEESIYSKFLNAAEINE